MSFENVQGYDAEGNYDDDHKGSSKHFSKQGKFGKKASFSKKGGHHGDRRREYDGSHSHETPVAVVSSPPETEKRHFYRPLPPIEYEEEKNYMRQPVDNRLMLPTEMRAKSLPDRAKSYRKSWPFFDVAQERLIKSDPAFPKAPFSNTGFSFGPSPIQLPSISSFFGKSKYW